VKYVALSETIGQTPAAALDSPSTIPFTTDSDQLKRKAILNLGGQLILLVVLTLFFCELAARFVVFIGKPAESQNPQHDIKYLVAKTVTNSDENVVLLGDSLIKQGLYPELITNKLRVINPHVRVVNLATSGGSQTDAVSYLEFLRTRQHVKPKLVVFDYEVSMTGFKTGERDFDFHQADSYLFKAKLDRPKTLLDKIKLLPSEYSYLYRQRGNIQHFLLDFLMAIPKPKAFQDKAFFNLHDASDIDSSESGMSPHHRVSSNKDAAEQERRIGASYEHSPRSGHFVYNRDAYSVIYKYCRDNNIPLLLVWLPHQSAIYRSFWYQAPYTEAWFEKEFAGYAKEPMLFALSLNHTLEDCKYYSDYHHLNTWGCIKASEKFAEALSQPTLRSLVASPAKENAK
jgi:hypothetical protein